MKILLMVAALFLGGATFALVVLLRPLSRITRAVAR